VRRLGAGALPVPAARRGARRRHHRPPRAAWRRPVRPHAAPRRARRGARAPCPCRRRRGARVLALTLAPAPRARPHPRMASRPSAPLPARMVGRGGEAPVLRVGSRPHPLRDVYHFLITATWWHLVLVFSLTYLGTNAAFATLYWLDPGGIQNARPGSYVDC